MLRAWGQPHTLPTGQPSRPPVFFYKRYYKGGFGRSPPKRVWAAAHLRSKSGVNLAPGRQYDARCIACPPGKGSRRLSSLPQQPPNQIPAQGVDFVGGAQFAVIIGDFFAMRIEQIELRIEQFEHGFAAVFELGLVQ